MQFREERSVALVERNFSGSHVKILVRVERDNGYPPEEWEGVWASPVSGNLYRIDNIPFYARNLSCDDIVQVRQSGEVYLLDRVVELSTNSTIRVIIYDLKSEQDIRSRLKSLGCAIEGIGIPGMIALNVPKDNLSSVIEFLEQGFAKGKWDFDEGSLRA